MIRSGPPERGMHLVAPDPELPETPGPLKRVAATALSRRRRSTGENTM